MAVGGAIDHKAQIKKTKLASTRERCLALRSELERYQSTTQLPAAPRYVVNALVKATLDFEEYLDELEKDPDLDLLTEDELENKIHFVSQHIPYLHMFLALILPSRIGGIPFELAAPLRREILKFFPDAELLVVSSPELNYRIRELAGPLRIFFDEIRRDPPADLPPTIFHVSFPSVEYDHALLHSVFAHEFGHPLYSEKNIEGKILPIKIDEDLIRFIYSNIKARASAQTDFIEEVEFRNQVTKAVNDTITNWIKEIAADLYAILLFGPAYLFAFIRLIVSFRRLDSGSISHPPPRLRIRLMFELLDEIFPKERTYSKTTKAFLDEWRSIGQRDINFGGRISSMVADSSLEKARAYDKLKRNVRRSLRRSQKYYATAYKKDVSSLTKYIRANVPPVEDIRNRKYSLATLVGILNAGWECFLSDLQEFRKNLPRASTLSRHEVNVEFNKFLLKAMELNDVKRSWEEAKKATEEAKKATGEV